MEILRKIISVVDVPTLISILAFFVVLLLFIGIVQYSRGRVRRKELIRKIQVSEGNIEAPSDSGSKFLKPVVSLFNTFGKRFAPGKSTDHSSSNLSFLRAGLRDERVKAVFWGGKVFFAISLPLLFILLKFLFFKAMTPIMSLYISLFAAFIGFYMPNIWLRNKIAKRKDMIFKGLPDALDLMVICIEAGIGLDAAINQVARELKLANSALSEEFNLFTLEMRTGKARAAALKSLALRTGLEDLDSLVTLLIQTEKFGTSVSRAMTVFADSFRTKRFQMAEEIAAKLPVKLLFPCILFIFPSLFAVIMGPAMIRVYQVFISR